MPNRKLRELAPQTGAHSSGTYRRVRTYPVLEHPHTLLAQPALDVDPRNPAVIALGEELVATMRTAPACVGLAATQVGVAMHVFCMDVSGHPKARSCSGLVVLANTRIIQSTGEVSMREGCLSVPHLTGRVKRAERVTVQGNELGTGRVVYLTADAFEARCLQHEIDHLDGLLFVDRVLDPRADLFPRKTYA